MKLGARPVRRLPPVLVVGLLALWLLLNRSLSVGHVALGLVVAVGVSWASSGLRPLQPRLRRAQFAGELLLRVLRDILRSNVNVARIVLGFRRDQELEAGFVQIPLVLKDPHGLAVLACIITATPGTVWVGHDVETSVLTLHVLDLKGRDALIAEVRGHYERLLREIFE
jgi:multicomponent K+:H+ antiporter subunit E